MSEPFEIFRSVGDVWIVWISSLALLACLIRRALRRMHWPRFRRFLSDERGSTYALPYVMAFPVYLMLVCLMIQPVRSHEHLWFAPAGAVCTRTPDVDTNLTRCDVIRYESSRGRGNPVFVMCNISAALVAVYVACISGFKRNRAFHRSPV